MQVTIDAGKCQGHGRCCLLAPEVFEVDDEGYGHVTSPDVPEGRLDEVSRAISSCPEGAITASG